MNYFRAGKLTIGLIALLAVLAAYFTTTLRFDYDFNKFFPTKSPDRVTYLQHADTFGNDNDYLLIGIERPEGIFDTAFLNKVHSLTLFLKSQPHVRSVLSPTTITNPVLEPFGLFQVPFVHLNEPARLTDDSVLIYRTEGLPGNLFSTKGTAVALVIETTPDLQKPPGDTLMANINSQIEALQLSGVHMAGKVVAQSVFVDRMQQELVVFIAASMLLLVFFLIIAFRTWWGVVIPLLVVVLTILFTLGLMGALGIPLDLMTTLLPTILFVVGISDVVHVVTRFTTYLQTGHDRISSLKKSMREVALAKFATSITTAIGFLSLLMIDIGPIATFGAITAAGVFIAYLLAISFLPALLLFVPLPQRIINSNSEFLWKKQLRKFFLWIMRSKKLIITSSVVLTVISGLLISTIVVDATLLDDLSDDDPLKEDFRFFEKHFAGVRPFEMHLQAANGTTVLELESLKEQEKLEQELRKIYGFSSFVSPVMVVKSVHKALNGGTPDAFRLPDSETELKKLLPRLKQLSKTEQFSRVLSADGKMARLSSKMPDIGSKRATALQEKLEEYTENEINPDLLHASVTGSAYLLDRNNSYITGNMLQGLSLNIALMIVLALAMFRTWRIIPVALIPNILPMLMIAGTMGLLGINMKVSTAIIYSIAFGIAVDDTIHFMSKLAIEFKKRQTVAQALKSTFLASGKAIILTSLMLSAGFLTLLLSSFEGTFYIGLLISLTLVFAVIADLILLPVLAILILRKTSRKRKVA